MEKMERKFTRADVEQYILKRMQWRDYATITVNRVLLFTILDGPYMQPAWQVEYTEVMNKGLYDIHRRTELLAQYREYDDAFQETFHLRSFMARELPEGCATVEEEDRVIKQEDKEMHQSLMKDLEQRRKQQETPPKEQ